MLLWLKGEGVVVDTWVGVTGVVIVWLGDVEILAWLLGKAILAVEDQLELVQRTNLGTEGTADSCWDDIAVEWNTILTPHAIGRVHVGNLAGSCLVIAGE